MHTNTHTQEPAAAADKKKPAAAGGRKRAAAKEEDAAAAPAAAAAEAKAAAAAPAAKKAKAGGGKLAAGDALPAFELETDGAPSRCAACVVCRDGRGTSLCSVASHIIHQHLSRHLPSSLNIYNVQRAWWSSPATSWPTAASLSSPIRGEDGWRQKRTGAEGEDKGSEALTRDRRHRERERESR